MPSQESRGLGTIVAQGQCRRRGLPGLCLCDDPRPWPHSQQLLVGPLLVGLVADISDVDGEVVSGAAAHDVTHGPNNDVFSIRRSSSNRNLRAAAGLVQGGETEGTSSPNQHDRRWSQRVGAVLSHQGITCSGFLVDDNIRNMLKETSPPYMRTDAFMK